VSSLALIEFPILFTQAGIPGQCLHCEDATAASLPLVVARLAPILYPYASGHYGLFLCNTPTT